MRCRPPAFVPRGVVYRGDTASVAKAGTSPNHTQPSRVSRPRVSAASPTLSPGSATHGSEPMSPSGERSAGRVARQVQAPRTRQVLQGRHVADPVAAQSQVLERREVRQRADVRHRVAVQQQHRQLRQPRQRLHVRHAVTRTWPAGCRATAAAWGRRRTWSRPASSCRRSCRPGAGRARRWSALRRAAARAPERPGATRPPVAARLTACRAGRRLASRAAGATLLRRVRSPRTAELPGTLSGATFGRVRRGCGQGSLRAPDVRRRRARLDALCDRAAPTLHEGWNGHEAVVVSSHAV